MSTLFATFYNLILNANIKNFDYIALSDQDDIFMKNKYSHAINQIKTFSSDCYSSSVRVLNNKKSTITLRQSSNFTKYDFLFEGAGQGCTFVMTSSFFISLKAFIKSNYNFITSAFLSRY